MVGFVSIRFVFCVALLCLFALAQMVLRDELLRASEEEQKIKGKRKIYNKKMGDVFVGEKASKEGSFLFRFQSEVVQQP